MMRRKISLGKIRKGGKGEYKVWICGFGVISLDLHNFNEFLDLNRVCQVYGLLAWDLHEGIKGTLYTLISVSKSLPSLYFIQGVRYRSI